MYANTRTRNIFNRICIEVHEKTVNNVHGLSITTLILGSRRNKPDRFENVLKMIKIITLINIIVNVAGITG